MNAYGSDRDLKAANPFPWRALAGLELGSAEAALEEAMIAEPAGTGAGEAAVLAARPHGRRRSRVIVALAGGLAAVAALAILLLSGGNAQNGPTRAYGAELVRFAESTPLLLLEGPGWRVQNANEETRREGVEGSMEFVTGKPIPYESVRITPVGGRGPGRLPRAERESGMFPPPVRQRRVELFWRHGSLAEAIATQRGNLHPHGQRWLELPVLDTTAEVDTRAEFYVNQGGPGNRQMVALWSEGGYLLELRAAVPSQAAFEERLGWLTKVDSQTWLDAMPAKVVKGADHEAVVREMLEAIPVPSTFEPSRVPNEGLPTNRYQVGADVTATVSCLWFLQWAKARRTDDRAAELEAEEAMASSKHWRVLREMAKEGAYPEAIWELAAEMPSGYREYAGHRWRLLPQAEALGCARLGLPLLPRKQKLQRERGVPLPPR
ncbi:MAG TPA: hypothetical protein VGC63_03955 [Solirubrobacterales bacterium]|jgi:hypothetical protein